MIPNIRRGGLMLRSRPRSRARLLLFLWAAIVQCPVGFAQSGDAGLNDATFHSYQSAIELRPEERAWLRIPWRTNLRTGIEDAAAEQKPLLFWLMNGHPLGCT